MLYVFGVLVCIILVVVATALFRSRGVPQNAGAPVSFPPRHGGTAPEVVPAASDLKASFDPDATRIYEQPPSFAPPGALKRDAALPIDPQRARLVCLSGIQKGKQFPIADAGIVVGRGPDCDIVLADGRVSSHHAWIGFVKGRLELHDLNSTNGTYVNEHIDTSVTEAELRANDTIFFGAHKAHQFRLLAD